MNKNHYLKNIELVYNDETVVIPAAQVVWYNTVADKVSIATPKTAFVGKATLIEVFEYVRPHQRKDWNEKIKKIKEKRNLSSIHINYSKEGSDIIYTPKPFWYAFCANADLVNPYIVGVTTQYSTGECVYSLYIKRELTLFWLKMALKHTYAYFRTIGMFTALKQLFGAILSKIKAFCRCSY